MKSVLISAKLKRSKMKINCHRKYAVRWALYVCFSSIFLSVLLLLFVHSIHSFGLADFGPIASSSSSPTTLFIYSFTFLECLLFLQPFVVVLLYFLHRPLAVCRLRFPSESEECGVDCGRLSWSNRKRKSFDLILSTQTISQNDRIK